MNDWQDSLKMFLDANPDLPQGEDAPASEQKDLRGKKKPRLDIILDRKGRAGKTATIVAGFGEGVSDEEIAAVAASLKKRLGVGGSCRGGEILIQGDRRKDVAAYLSGQGYKTRLI